MKTLMSRWMKGGLAFVAMFAFGVAAHASVAYGALSNFDTVNDTGHECHGFEIELEDVHSTDITYTYDYNHYGTPSIREDNSVPGHPKVFIRWESKKDAAGNYLSFTAIPAAPLPATQGHQCTNPGVNLGCEHFGVGNYGTVTAAFYNWLIDDGAGHLVHGPAVNVATPTFTYVQQQLQVAVPAPPPPPEVHPAEFGDAVWVKSIVTTAHNNDKIALRDLVSDDPNDAHDKNWKNGEADEVEIDWEILQREFAAADGGANGEQHGKPEQLANNDEVVTRRYESYKYIGPYDPQSHEAVCDKFPDPAPKPECVGEIVGDFIGAQMVAFEAAAPLGLIDNVQDGKVTQPYPQRTIVVGGNTPYQSMVTRGALPNGLALASATGVLSGTPTQVGRFTFTVDAIDADNVHVFKDYALAIAIVPRAGDLDGDGDIDLTDINAMKLRFGQAANGAGDLDDVNHDGVINILDIRKAISMCTRAKCATQ